MVGRLQGDSICGVGRFAADVGAVGLGGGGVTAVAQSGGNHTNHDICHMTTLH